MGEGWASHSFTHARIFLYFLRSSSPSELLLTTPRGFCIACHIFRPPIILSLLLSRPIVIDNALGLPYSFHSLLFSIVCSVLYVPQPQQCLQWQHPIRCLLRIRSRE